MPLETPSQTIGPFFHGALVGAGECRMAGDGAAGERIRMVGRVLDGAGEAVADAMLEVWQANGLGHYRHPDDRQGHALDQDFSGFGRCATAADGGFAFETVRPGPVVALDGGLQAPHLNVTVFARGLLIHASTRFYFSDEAANANDAVLQSVPNQRRDTLIARLDPASDPPCYRLDVVLCGDRETVFFDV